MASLARYLSAEMMNSEISVFNFGSLNIDLVYRVHDFVRPGETVPALGFARFAGGKGLNQSIALSRAGAKVIHAGAVGSDGAFLLELLRENGVDCSGVAVEAGEVSGHAVIQVADSGENSIVLYPGANHCISAELIHRVLEQSKEGDVLLLQNEISSIPAIMRTAAERGLRIFMNPAPMTPQVLEYPLELVDTLIVNETESELLAKRKLSPAVNVLKTLGARGAVYNDSISVESCRVDRAVDTTAAGDTCSVFFIAGVLAVADIGSAMRVATAASALCIQRAGAAASIPYRKELDILAEQ